MVEQRAMASTSFGGKSLLLVREDSSNFRPYPQLDGKYEDVVSDPKLFMNTLEKLHVSMGTKFMIPIIGGKELDLHRLFQEVTSRGGIEKILKDRRWKEVTAVFNFPSTATNASFVLRKYYYSLLHHYEQIYYFKAQGFIPVSGGNMHSSPRTPVSAPRAESFQSLPPEFQQAPTSEAELPGALPRSSTGCPVIGVIDGKFESGYLVTVTIGSEKLKGVLYQAPQNLPWQAQHGTHLQPPASSNRNDIANASSDVPRVHRRRRRKKSEIKRRDPAHPKPNRSGYNFFFAEQHARLKPLHPGKDREISRMIGELWNKLTESERAVYQEKAVKDKERYRIEMEGYRERLRTGSDQVISDAVPLRQRFPEQDISMVELDTKMDEAEGQDSPQTLDDESSSSKSDSDDDGAEEKAFDAAAAEEEYQETEAGIEIEPEDANMEKADEERDVNFGHEEAKEEEPNTLY